jgi:hypothetical protein
MEKRSQRWGAVRVTRVRALFWWEIVADCLTGTIIRRSVAGVNNPDW